MDPVIGAAAVSAAGNIVGGLIGNDGDAARDNRRQTVKLIRERGQAVRQGAERSGFNPLTYLAATSNTSVGGSTAGGPAPLASIGAAISTFGNMMYERKIAEEQQERTHKSAMAQLEAIQKAQREAGGAGSTVTRTIGGLASNKAAEATDPDTTDLWSLGSTQVLGPDGTVMELPTKVAKRLKIEAGDALLAEDYEAMFGDEGGQVVFMPRLPGAVQQNLGGLTGYDVEERKERRKEPWSLRSLGIHRKPENFDYNQLP